MTGCWLVVNTLWGVGMQVVAEAVALGSTLDLPRDLLFDTLAKTAVVAPAHIGKLAGTAGHPSCSQRHHCFHTHPDKRHCLNPNHTLQHFRRGGVLFFGHIDFMLS